MTIEEFIDSPWNSNSVHSSYGASFLHMRPAPEYATGEVVLASCYRQTADSGKLVTEGKVPQLGRDFYKAIQKGGWPKGKESPSGIDSETWQRIVTGTLRSPKQPNQTSKRFLLLSPVVPDAALYSQSARQTAKSWNPGALVARMIQFGEKDPAAAEEVWGELYEALCVKENDDIWARFLQEEFYSWRNPKLEGIWGAATSLEDDEAVRLWNASRHAPKTPSRRFVEDLKKVISLKERLTRRQWTSILESAMRLGTASHVLWVCMVNMRVNNILLETIAGKSPPNIEELSDILDVRYGFWRYGQYAASTINDFSTEFIKARAGINLALYFLEKQHGVEKLKGCLSNPERLVEIFDLVAKNREDFPSGEFEAAYRKVIESDQRILSGKKGIASNVKEFLRHVLGKRQTAEAGLDSYDQGYYLDKKGKGKAGRWIVSLGPVSVLFLVHACTHRCRGPSTIDHLSKHLAEYGIEVTAQDVMGSAFGKTLRNLGIVLDSPDAEGGMIIVDPFAVVRDREDGI